VDGEQEDEVAADAAMLSEEEALIVTNRLHQVPWKRLGQLSHLLAVACCFPCNVELGI